MKARGGGIMKYFLLFLVILISVGTVNAQAALRTQVVEYKYGDVVLEGYLAYDDAVKGKRPGVIVVHEWMGHNPYVRM